MHPGFAQKNSRNRRFVNTVLNGERLVGYASLRVTSPYLSYLRFGQLGHCSAVHAWPLSGLFHHIGTVVGSRPQEKMRGAHAAWVVAMVTDMHIVWYGAEFKLPCGAMREFISAVKPERPITFRQWAAYPFPATIRGFFVDLFPEAFGRGTDSSMSKNVSERLTVYPSESPARLWCERCKLTATALAVTVWDFVRGIIEGHRNLLGCGVKPWDAETSPGQLFAYSIIPRTGDAF